MNLQNISAFLIIITLSVFILIKAKLVIAPIVFSIFLSLSLKPVATFFEKKVKRRIFAIFMTFLVAVIPLSLAVLFFSYQSMSIFRELPMAQDKLSNAVKAIYEWVNNRLQLGIVEPSQWVLENISAILDIPLSFIGESIQSTTLVLANVVLVVIISFFLLLYRTAFKNLMLIQFAPGGSRDNIESLIDKIQGITQQYLFGLGLVILILGFLTGTGLSLIGVPFAFFWGFLAAFLGIIPYVGTTIGGILPFLYVLAISTSFWQPLAVVGLYLFIQQIEGNFITPYVMGSSIKINPLFAIVGLFIGGVIWGIAGMILALPVIAVIKEILRSFDVTTPFSYIMENNLVKNSDIFYKKFDKEKYRILRMFVQEK